MTRATETLHDLCQSFTMFPDFGWSGLQMWKNNVVLPKWKQRASSSRSHNIFWWLYLYPFFSSQKHDCGWDESFHVHRISRGFNGIKTCPHCITEHHKLHKSNRSDCVWVPNVGHNLPFLKSHCLQTFLQSFSSSTLASPALRVTGFCWQGHLDTQQPRTPALTDT